MLSDSSQCERYYILILVINDYWEVVNFDIVLFTSPLLGHSRYRDMELTRQRELETWHPETNFG